MEKLWRRESIVGEWGHGRGRDEQGGADYIAELRITERETLRRRDGRDEQGRADYIAELRITERETLRRRDGRDEQGGPIISLSFV